MAEGGASRTELLERRAERDLVREGKAVLEERRDLLAHLLLDELRATARLNAERDRLFELAREQLRRAALRHGVGGLRRFATAGSNLARPPWRLENRLGTAWLVGAAALAETPARDPGAGIDVSLELDGALAALQRLLFALLRSAEAENNLARVTDAFRRTQRRVNALDHIVLPEIDAAIRRMEGGMDEMERDDLVRALLIKRRHAAGS